ncbi:hypothetical protein AYO36_04680 [Exiguobacterium sp. KKBO11]|uniref:hypothetical protein n=1 Tax=Exiguobacterium sp. KKBO11 TaxID=1805000 RepID=UPI0007D875A3|nr:hypothetical protein [Exiguobacterium sp. KKBO11]OAI89454.1 hypothetical protein AYO36_04680 [Exiguobacterium sp. KKBO11]
MTVVYILLAALVCYALLVLFRQQAALKDRITRLEREKNETEQVLLHFMENVNAMTETSVIEANKQVDQVPDASPQMVKAATYEKSETVEIEQSISKEPTLTDVKQALREGADLETLARSLNRGTGEVALIAKLSHQTKVAPR